MKKTTGSKKIKQSWGTMVVLGIYICFGGTCGLLLAVMEDLPLFQQAPTLLCLLILLLCMFLFAFLHTLLHEGGHLLFGLLTGYRFCSFRIASFMWFHDGEKIRFARHSLPGTGGQCLLEPPDMVDGKMPYVLYNLGGVLMNALLSLLALLPALLWGQDTLWGVLCLLFALAGFTAALTNGIPLEVNLLSNDGSNALYIHRHPEALRALWIQLKVNACQTRGQRLQDMPEEWFVLPEKGHMTHTLVAALGDFRECLLLERQDFAGAESLISELLGDNSLALGAYRPMLQNDGIFLALLRGDVATARRYLTPEQQAYMKKCKLLSFFRTSYAVALLLDKDEKAAQTMRKDFEKATRRWPYANDIAEETRLLERVDVLWKASQSQP